MNVGTKPAKKTCNKCGVTKSAREFYANTGNVCKACWREKNLAYYHSHKEYFKLYKKSYKPEQKYIPDNAAMFLDNISIKQEQKTELSAPPPATVFRVNDAIYHARCKRRLAGWRPNLLGIGQYEWVATCLSCLENIYLTDGMFSRIPKGGDGDDSRVPVLPEVQEADYAGAAQ